MDDEPAAVGDVIEVEPLYELTDAALQYLREQGVEA